ncbi:unnamed protein product [Durusdinium trenchii]|uniref:EF-hand domain-containing protein n=1 Tax=Durusdinium trenchii TaxID=1381693 RepID=A0ABP0NAL2_9DINO
MAHKFSGDFAVRTEFEENEDDEAEKFQQVRKEFEENEDDEAEKFQQEAKSPTIAAGELKMSPSLTSDSHSSNTDKETLGFETDSPVPKSVMASGEWTRTTLELPSTPINSSKRAAAGGMSNFIKVKRRDDWQDEKTLLRRRAARLISSPYVANFMAIIVIVDSYCTCADIDARAANPDDGRPDVWITRLSEICLVLYTVELVLLLLLKGVSVLKKDLLMTVDVLIVVCGYTEWFLGQFLPEVLGNLGVLRTLRFLRIIRLLRLLRKIHGLRELQKLVIMMATCLKTLAWSFLFCFVIMTVWAMLMVELVHPLIGEIYKENSTFAEECPQCISAASSVMHANLLLFKTVIAGDSWGLIAVPVIERYPATALIFMGSQLTIVFGVLNLIVAVVVDTFAEARERDVLNLAEEMERNHENDKKFLQKVFERIDEDGSGELTLEELVEGARQDPEFQSRLRVMDIDEVDLQQLFEMIDVDGSGSIEAHEFIAPLSRWVHESKTAPRFIKYNMLRSMQQQDELYRQSWYQFNALSTKLEELSSTVDHLAHRGPSESVAPSVPSEMSSPEEASPNHRSSRRSSRPSRMSDRTASLDEVEGMMSPQEKAEDVASEHPEGPAEQPQASSLMFDWRPGPRPARNRLGSEEGHFVRKHSLEQIHENQRSSSASTGPGASAVGTLEMSELSAAFQSNSRLLKVLIVGISGRSGRPLLLNNG